MHFKINRSGQDPVLDHHHIPNHDRDRSHRRRDDRDRDTERHRERRDRDRRSHSDSHHRHVHGSELPDYPRNDYHHHNKYSSSKYDNKQYINDNRSSLNNYNRSKQVTLSTITGEEIDEKNLQKKLNKN